MLETTLGTLYSMESMRTVPDGDTAAEACRQENIERLGENLNQVRLIQGIDKANTMIRVASYRLEDHMNDTQHALREQAECRYGDTQLLKRADGEVLNSPLGLLSLRERDALKSAANKPSTTEPDQSEVPAAVITPSNGAPGL